MTFVVPVLAALALDASAPSSALWEGEARDEIVAGIETVRPRVLSAGDVVWDVQVRSSRTARLTADYLVPSALGTARIPQGTVLTGMTFLNTVKRGSKKPPGWRDSFLAWCTKDLACFSRGERGEAAYKGPSANDFAPAPMPALAEERGLVPSERYRIVLKAVEDDGVIVVVQRGGAAAQERRMRWVSERTIRRSTAARSASAPQRS